jgi:hypothetical protein
VPELTRPDGCRLYFETHGSPEAEPLIHSEQPDAADGAVLDFVRRNARG